MSWSFPFNFDQGNHVMNNYPQFSPFIYGNQFCPNISNHQVPNQAFNFHPNYLLFPPGCPQTTIHPYLDQRNSFINQPYDYNSSFPHQQKERKKSTVQDQISQSEQSNQEREQEGGQIKMIRFRRRRTFKKPKNEISHNSSLRNDTKNIPKNYGKAMLSYIQKNGRQAKELLSSEQVDTLQFMMTVKSFKSRINTIHDLRQMWGQNQKENKVKKCIRILSYHFMRKKCLPYIFNSRVKNYHTHIKYRKKIMEGIENPQNFTKIKEF